MDIHIASDGSKRGSSGTTVTTLLEARDAAREIIAAGLNEPLTLHLSGGVHRLAEPLVLGGEDSGTAEYPVVWRGAEGEKVLISGGVPVSSWERCADLPGGAPEVAAGRVWTAPLPEGVAQPRTLFDAEGLLSRARSPEFAGEEREGVTDNQTLCFAPGSLPCRPRADMELFLKPCYPWIVNALPVESVDNENGILRTTIPGTYPLKSRLGWKIVEGTCNIQNVPEGLTAPGTWFVDVAAKMFYLWPRSGDEPEEVFAPVVNELIRFEGDEEDRNWVHDIALEGLTLSHADRLSWPRERIAAQHDWELYEGATALVRLRGAERITVRNCRFEESGGGGLRSECHGVDNVVTDNSFTQLGGSGIAFVGHRPGNRDEHHHNEITRNRIEEIGRILWHSSGIFLCQSGHNRVADNLLRHLPYSGIVLVSGRSGIYGDAAEGRSAPGYDGRGGVVCWDELSDCPNEFINRIGFLTCRYNIIEHNEIHHCMEVLGDGNGIYISGTGVGNVTRRNWVHDIAGQGCQSGIRFDDRQWHCRVEENVVARISGGGITIKDVNDVENNIVVDCARWGSVLVRREKSWGSNIRRNILVQSGLPFTDGQGLEPPFYDGKGFGGKLEEPTIEDNLLWCTEDPAAGEACLARMRAIGKETRSVLADPCFVDAAADDYRLRPESPALRIGFRPIECWGIRMSMGSGSTD